MRQAHRCPVRSEDPMYFGASLPTASLRALGQSLEADGSAKRTLRCSASLVAMRN